MEYKLNKMEEGVFGLVKESVTLFDKKDMKHALEKAKEAGSLFSL